MLASSGNVEVDLRTVIPLIKLRATCEIFYFCGKVELDIVLVTIYVFMIYCTAYRMISASYNVTQKDVRLKS